MDWICGMQKALDYIETHLTESLNYEQIAKEALSSSFHFQRVFSLLCGYTLGEYIRNRRLTLAGAELASSQSKVIDIALKYGYENPDSFAKAFQRFHGITPSAARESGVKLYSFAPLVIKLSLEGGTMLNYRIEEREAMLLTGYRQRFHGVPYGPERLDQENDFFTTTRAKQWLLTGATWEDRRVFYNVITNIGDDGYDYYYAMPLSKWTREHLYDPNTTGIAFMEQMCFEDIVIAKQTYAIFETTRSQQPITEYGDIRHRIVSEWLPSSGYQLAESPEIVKIFWPNGSPEKYIEIWLPIEKQ